MILKNLFKLKKSYLRNKNNNFHNLDLSILSYEISLG